VAFSKSEPHSELSLDYLAYLSSGEPRADDDISKIMKRQGLLRNSLSFSEFVDKEQRGDKGEPAL
jgi:hypothetical protein